MKKEVDRNFSILNACSGEVVGYKMPYYTYLMQLAGFKLNYKYSLHTNRIRSHGLRDSIDSLIADGSITNKYKITDIGFEAISQYGLTVDVIKKADVVVEYVKSVSVDTLFFACVINMVIEDKLNNSGYISLVTDKQEVLDTVSYLCGEKVFEEFDACIGALRKIKSC